MDRWQIAAIALAVGLLAASLLLRPTTPPGPAPEAMRPSSEAPREESPTEFRATAPSAESAGPRQEQLLTLANDAVELRVSDLGGRVETIDLLKYRATVAPDSGPVELVTVASRGAMFLFLGPEPLRSFEAVPCEITSRTPTRVELRAVRDGITLTRRIELDDSGYGGRLTVSISNAGAATVQPKLELVFYGQERAATAPDHFPHYSLAASVDGSVKRLPVQGVGSTGFVGSLLGRGPPTGTAYPAPAEWAGIDSQYFLLAAVPQNPRDASAYFGPLGADLGQAALALQPFDVPPGTGIERSYRLYFGPKIEANTSAVDPQLAHATDAGWPFVRPLVAAFGSLLHWTHDHVVPNYGIAIILLTILVRMLTYPLTQRSMKSMKKFSLIAPQMKEIQEKHANDRDKLQEELMKLYRQKGMNPLAAMGGGCVPMIIQMPVMIALYFALQTSIDLRHAPFALWIRDLSAPEDFFAVAGVPFRLLPLLMGGSMLLQQRLSPAPNADPQQRQMMTLMSVMFTFMFYQFPAGLVLYWFVSNLLGIAQQLLVNRAPAPTTT
ncbi:MAG: membrane protein insertase YidC [Myxococcota bacterium]